MLTNFVKFSIVGISGTIVNLAVYAAAVYVGMYYLAAAVFSFLFAVTNNFYWNFTWTFRGQAKERSFRTKYLSFLGFSILNLAVNLFILRAFVENLGMDKNVAQLVAIALVSVLNFGMNAKFTFGQDSERLTSCETNGGGK